MEKGGTVLDQYSIAYSELELGEPIGEGSFGTVFKGKLHKRNASSLGIDVAVKRMRVEKVTPKVVTKFRAEIIASVLATRPLACAYY